MQTIDVVFDDQSSVSFDIHPDTTVGDVLKEMIKKSEEGSISVFNKTLTIDDMCIMHNSRMLSVSEKLYSNENESEGIKKQYSCFIDPTLNNKDDKVDEYTMPLSKKFALANSYINSKGELIMEQEKDDIFDKVTPFILIVILFGISYLVFA